MGYLSLDEIIVSPLKKIPTKGGDILHALREFDPGYNGFGEVYFSFVEKGAIKAWKCHQRMTLNLVVPIGEISFVFHLPDGKNSFRSEIIGKSRYSRLTVPAGIWFGFQGNSNGDSLLMNLADITHDPDEVLHKELNEINFEWRTK